MSSIWKKDNLFDYDDAYFELDNFFENLYRVSSDRDYDYDNKYKGLCYRQEQNSYALDIMEAIKENQILLVQAGVGTGKSYGYLLPIFYTYKNVSKFNKIIISTSSIALQQQLLTDINRISNMLNVEIKASIAKGINNYVCIKRIESFIHSSYTCDDKKELLRGIVRRIEEIGSCDKEDLLDFSKVIWDELQLQSRGFCSNCYYSNRCPFYLRENLIINDSNIIITNHANFVKNIIDGGELIDDSVDMVIFDEAHQLESNIRGVRSNKLFLRDINRSINYIRAVVGNSGNDVDDIGIDYYIDNLMASIKKVFSSLRRSSSIQFSSINRSNNSITDCSKLSFKYNNTIMSSLSEVLSGFKMLFRIVEDYEKYTNVSVNVDEIKRLEFLFKDMSLRDDSNNIYWTEFFKDNLINLCYAPKSNLEIMKRINSKNIPIVYTSATLSTTRDNNYSYFMNNLELNDALNNRMVVLGENYLSPFDYQSNTLFYYDSSLPVLSDYDNYVIELSLKVIELIRATEGKALVLFTSKKCMNDVYNLVSKENFGFSIFLQMDNNANYVKDAFSREVNSCLFATGAFWEGIDVKGDSLSNLVITHLPFLVVDAVNQYKASKYSSSYDQFREIYVPNMLLKLKQAMGRLIRSDEDLGIISCLDSRFVRYKDQVESISQVTNYTSDMKDVYDFVNCKVLKRVK